MIRFGIVLAVLIYSWPLSGFAATVVQKMSKEHLSGTGFSVTKDGYILTSAHVVDSQPFVIVRSSDQKVQNRAKIIAIDRKLDLALLKIDAETIEMPIGNWDSVIGGQEVISLGFPNPTIQGESLKITSGIVSSRLGTASNEGIFPFNAAVQSGNSGGPVLSLAGSVIGVIYGFSVVNSNVSQVRDSLSYAVNALQLRRFLDRQGVNYTMETAMQPLRRAQDLYQAYERGVFIIEAKAEDPILEKGKTRKRKDIKLFSVAEFPEKLRGLLKTLPEREQPRLFGAYKAGYDRIEEFDDSYILIKSGSVKPENSPTNKIIIFESIISYKRERTSGSGEPYLSLLMSARFDCTNLTIDVFRQELKPEAFGSGKSIIAKKRSAETQAQWSLIKSERRRDVLRTAVCDGDKFSTATSEKD